MKLIRHRETDQVLGVHIAGDDAAEMIKAVVLLGLQNRNLMKHWRYIQRALRNWSYSKKVAAAPWGEGIET